VAVERISVERCRQLVGRGSDEELATVRDQLYALADVAVRAFCELQASERRAPAGAFDQALNWLHPEDAEDAKERAAIIEFEAGTSRADAERKALSAVVSRRRREFGDT
jgi:hypothetical protein